MPGIQHRVLQSPSGILSIRALAMRDMDVDRKEQKMHAVRGFDAVIK